MKRKFDTKVQELKYKVLREVARASFNDNLEETLLDIPKIIVPKNEATMRCCVYKERAIVQERMKLAMNIDISAQDEIVQVLDIACDECPADGYIVTDMCRGCLAHRCQEACPRDTIEFDNLKAHINKDKCINCGLCAKACPYHAIQLFTRPCIEACKAGAISIGPSGAAQIDYGKCTDCGSCVYLCPFGAIQDKSYILDVVDLIKNSNNNTNYKLYAVVAPAIYSQFSYAKLGQVVKGLKELGFFTVVEAALGADSVSLMETAELYEKQLLTSSCCPAFVKFIEKQYPDLEQYVSHNPSPMVAISKYIKETDPSAKVVFIGPCTAKKAECKKAEISPFVDTAITFEELQALFDAKDIDLPSLEEDYLNNASYFGRIFARSGGLTDAVGQALKEMEITDFEVKPIVCSGLDDCKKALMMLRRGHLGGNFIEGMACVDGCINGAGVLTHGPKNKASVDKYGMEAIEKSISDAVSQIK